MPVLRRLSKRAISHLSKPHTGFEAFVEPLARLVEQYASKLGMEGIDIARMRASLSDMQQLTTQRDAARQQLALLENSRLFAASNVWDQLLLIYASARQAARVNADIEGAIDAFTQFMKNGPRKRKAPIATQP